MHAYVCGCVLDFSSHYFLLKKNFDIQGSEYAYQMQEIQIIFSSNSYL